MAPYEDFEDWIRTENAADGSVDDQVKVAYWFLDRGFTLVVDRVARTSQVRERVGHRIDHTIRTVLDNLEEIGVLVQFDPPGGGSYIRHHRTGENFFDPSSRDYVPLLEEDLSRLIADLEAQAQLQPAVADGGEQGQGNEEEQPETLRSVAAEALEVDEPDVEQKLREPSDPIERMNQYDGVVKAIKRSDEVSRGRNYDEMGFRSMALRWTLSERAVAIETS